MYEEVILQAYARYRSKVAEQLPRLKSDLLGFYESLSEQENDNYERREICKHLKAHVNENNCPLLADDYRTHSLALLRKESLNQKLNAILFDNCSDGLRLFCRDSLADFVDTGTDDIKFARAFSGFLEGKMTVAKAAELEEVLHGIDLRLRPFFSRILDIFKEAAQSVDKIFDYLPITGAELEEVLSGNIVQFDQMSLIRKRLLLHTLYAKARDDSELIERFNKIKKPLFGRVIDLPLEHVDLELYGDLVTDKVVHVYLCKFSRGIKSINLRDTAVSSKYIAEKLLPHVLNQDGKPVAKLSSSYKSFQLEEIYVGAMLGWVKCKNADVYRVISDVFRLSINSYEQFCFKHVNKEVFEKQEGEIEMLVHVGTFCALLKRYEYGLEKIDLASYIKRLELFVKRMAIYVDAVEGVEEYYIASVYYLCTLLNDRLLEVSLPGVVQQELSSLRIVLVDFIDSLAMQVGVKRTANMAKSFIGLKGYDEIEETVVGEKSTSIKGIIQWLSNNNKRGIIHDRLCAISRGVTKVKYLNILGVPDGDNDGRSIIIAWNVLMEIIERFGSGGVLSDLVTVLRTYAQYLQMPKIAGAMTVIVDSSSFVVSSLQELMDKVDVEPELHWVCCSQTADLFNKINIGSYLAMLRETVAPNKVFIEGFKQVFQLYSEAVKSSPASSEGERLAIVDKLIDCWRVVQTEFSDLQGEFIDTILSIEAEILVSPVLQIAVLDYGTNLFSKEGCYSIRYSRLRNLISQFNVIKRCDDYDGCRQNANYFIEYAVRLQADKNNFSAYSAASDPKKAFYCLLTLFRQDIVYPREVTVLRKYVGEFDESALKNRAIFRAEMSELLAKVIEPLYVNNDINLAYHELLALLNMTDSTLNDPQHPATTLTLICLLRQSDNLYMELLLRLAVQLGVTPGQFYSENEASEVLISVHSEIADNYAAGKNGFVKNKQLAAAWRSWRDNVFDSDVILYLAMYYLGISHAQIEHGLTSKSEYSHGGLFALNLLDVDISSKCSAYRIVDNLLQWLLAEDSPIRSYVSSGQRALARLIKIRLLLAVESDPINQAMRHGTCYPSGAKGESFALREGLQFFVDLIDAPISCILHWPKNLLGAEGCEVHELVVKANSVAQLIAMVVSNINFCLSDDNLLVFKSRVAINAVDAGSKPVLMNRILQEYLTNGETAKVRVRLAKKTIAQLSMQLNAMRLGEHDLSNEDCLKLLMELASLYKINDSDVGSLIDVNFVHSIYRKVVQYYSGQAQNNNMSVEKKHIDTCCGYIDYFSESVAAPTDSDLAVVILAAMKVLSANATHEIISKEYSKVQKLCFDLIEGGDSELESSLVARLVMRKKAAQSLYSVLSAPDMREKLALPHFDLLYEMIGLLQEPGCDFYGHFPLPLLHYYTIANMELAAQQLFAKIHHRLVKCVEKSATIFYARTLVEQSCDNLLQDNIVVLHAFYASIIDMRSVRDIHFSAYVKKIYDVIAFRDNKDCFDGDVLAIRALLGRGETDGLVLVIRSLVECLCLGLVNRGDNLCVQRTGEKVVFYNAEASKMASYGACFITPATVQKLNSLARARCITEEGEALVHRLNSNQLDALLLRSDKDEALEADATIVRFNDRNLLIARLRSFFNFDKFLYLSEDDVDCLHRQLTNLAEYVDDYNQVITYLVGREFARLTVEWQRRCRFNIDGAQIPKDIVHKDKKQEVLNSLCSIIEYEIHNNCSPEIVLVKRNGRINLSAKQQQELYYKAAELLYAHARLYAAVGMELDTANAYIGLQIVGGVKSWSEVRSEIILQREMCVKIRDELLRKSFKDINYHFVCLDRYFSFHSAQGGMFLHAEPVGDDRQYAELKINQGPGFLRTFFGGKLRLFIKSNSYDYSYFGDQSLRLTIRSKHSFYFQPRNDKTNNRFIIPLSRPKLVGISGLGKDYKDLLLGVALQVAILPWSGIEISHSGLGDANKEFCDLVITCFQNAYKEIRELLTKPEFLFADKLKNTTEVVGFVRAALLEVFTDQGVDPYPCLSSLKSS